MYDNDNSNRNSNNNRNNNNKGAERARSFAAHFQELVRIKWCRATTEPLVDRILQIPAFRVRVFTHFGNFQFDIFAFPLVGIKTTKQLSGVQTLHLEARLLTEAVCHNRVRADPTKKKKNKG